MTQTEQPIPRVAYRFKEAMVALGVNEHALRELMNTGALRYSRVGRCVLIPAEALDEMLRATQESPRRKAVGSPNPVAAYIKEYRAQQAKRAAKKNNPAGSERGRVAL